ncbi:MAG TPA: TadE/TadG family type IV pilus assembly protein [Terracidiphilus sp.]|jgi:Flp pilus assembly protein TadG|nr:TadE/TadG family type IV pilus assembly protein [Terracidiphilus sp.]
MRTAKSSRRHNTLRRLLSRIGLRLPGRIARLNLRKEDGAELVEFALASTVFCMFIFGFMELCTVLFMYSSMAEAARETTRWASVRGASSSVTSNGVTSCANPYITQCPATSTQVQNLAKTFLGGSNMSVQVWWCNADGQTNCTTSNSNAQKGNIVKVKVSYTFASVPFVSRSALTVGSTSEMVIWQ